MRRKGFRESARLSVGVRVAPAEKEVEAVAAARVAQRTATIGGAACNAWTIPSDRDTRGQREGPGKES